MGKTKHAKDEEWYKGIIREQRSEIKRLKQRIKQLEKFEHNYNNPKEPDDEEPIEKLPKCERCGKGFLKELELVNRIFEVCSLCDYRSKSKVMKRRKKSG